MTAVSTARTKSPESSKAARGAIGKCVRRHEIASDHVEGIEAHFDGDPLPSTAPAQNTSAARRIRVVRSASCW